MLISKGRGRVGDIVMNVGCPRRRGSGVEFIVRELFRKDLFGERRKKKVRENSRGRMRYQIKVNLD